MPSQATRHVGPAVKPAQSRFFPTDSSGSAVEHKPGWLCDGRGMLSEHYKTEGKIAVKRGQYGEAENFFHAAIEQAEQIGSFNPCLVDSLNELGVLYAKQHKYAQAESMFHRSLGVSVAALGSDHPDVAIILRNIGILKASQRQYAEAELLLNQSLSLTHRVLGHEHPIAAGTMRTCAVFYAIQGHYGEAERFIRRSLDISQRALGSEHPEVAASRKVFVHVLHTMHRDTEASRAGLQAQDFGTRSALGS